MFNRKELKTQVRKQLREEYLPAVLWWWSDCKRFLLYEWWCD